MNDMYAVRFDREQFGQIFRLGTLPKETHPVRLIEDELLSDPNLYAVWDSEPGERPGVPQLLLVPPERQTDLFAWTQTYVPGLRPFTAFCRVLSAQEAVTFSSGVKKPDLALLSDACLGLIYGETASFVEGRRSMESLSATAFKSTFSFAAARGLAIGLPRSSLERFYEQWSFVRSVRNSGSEGFGSSTVKRVWDYVLALGPGEESRKEEVTGIVSTLREMRDIGKIQPDISRELSVPETVRSIFGDMVDNSRENRLIAFRRIAEILSVEPRENLVSGFVCGLAASLISGGRFEHSGILLRYLNAFPDLLLWYGLCLGLSRQADLKTYGNGVGYRLLREILRRGSLLDVPTCDIAVKELDVLVRSGLNLGSFYRANSSLVEIEVAPCVNTVLGTLMQSETSAQQELTLSTPSESPEFNSENLERALHLTSELRLLLQNSIERSKRGGNRKSGSKRG
jgi:hypothetical protein